MALRLNLASGTDIKDDWVNLDVVAWPTARRAPDAFWDARKDRIPAGTDTVDEIYAGYLLLHLAPNYHDFVLREILRVLKPGARAVFGEVDYAKVFPRWLENPDDVQMSELIWGEQGIRAHGVNYADFDKHAWGFTEAKLRKVLEHYGLRNTNRIWIHKQPEVFYELTLEAYK